MSDCSNPLGLEEAIISPEMFVEPLEGCPEVAVTTYSRKVVDAYVTDHDLESVTVLTEGGGPVPIYLGDADGSPFLLYQSPVGAPASVSLMEEVAVLGCDTFVMFGSCGVIDGRSVGNAKVIVPCWAWSDEGTSLHYGRDARDRKVGIPAESFMRVGMLANELHIPHITAPVWTTDGFYRETRSKVEEMRLTGCVVVEMELSAMAQASKSLGLRLYPFLHVADDLSGEGYDKGSLTEHGMSGWEMHMSLAEAIVRSHCTVDDETVMTPRMLRKDMEG